MSLLISGWGVGCGGELELDDFKVSVYMIITLYDYHSWLIQLFQLYRLHGILINFLEHSLSVSNLVFFSLKKFVEKIAQMLLKIFLYLYCLGYISSLKENFYKKIAVKRKPMSQNAMYCHFGPLQHLSCVENLVAIWGKLQKEICSD